MQWMISAIDSIGIIVSKRVERSQQSKVRQIVVDVFQSQFQKRLLAAQAAEQKPVA